MLDDNLKAQLKAYLERVKLPFTITASLDEGASSQEMHEFLQDIVGLTDKITLKTDGTDARRPSFALAPARRGGAHPLRRHPHGPRVHLAGARAAAGRRPSAQDRAGADRPDQGPRRRAALRDLHEPHLPQLPGRGPGVEPAGRAQPAHQERGHRRRPVPGGGRAPAGAGRADGVPQRPAFRPGPDGSRRDRQEARHRLGRARRRQAGRQGRVRRADRRRRPRGRGRGRVRGAQGHPHRPAGRAHGRPDHGHHEHRELHLGAGDRRPEVRRGAGEPRQALRRRHHEPAARHAAAARRRRRPGRRDAGATARRSGARP